MPLPGNLTQVRIGCDLWLDIVGDPLVGKTLTLQAVRSRFTDAGAYAVIYSTLVTATVDSGGAAWVVVPATDDPDIAPDFWNYTVTEPGGQSYYIIAPSTSPVDIITGYPTINLSTATAAPGPAQGVAQVISGEDGLGVLTGTVVPSNTLGVNGQAYIDTTHGKLYAKAAGVWNAGLNLVGGATSVTSVNTKTGVVVLTADDVDAVDTADVGVAGGVCPTDAGNKVPLAFLPSGLGAVASVNGHTGVVVLAASDVGAIATGGSAVPTAHWASHKTGGSDPGLASDIGGASVTARPVNVRNQSNPLANAIMDGATHPLSTRFASLGAAQAVFPAATALTEEIDYYAIQTPLNTVRKVYLSNGTALLHKSLQIPTGATKCMEGEGEGVTVLKLRTGSNSNVIDCLDQTNENPSISLIGFTVDGNAANNTGTIGQTDGIHIYRGKDAILRNLEVMNMNGRGIHSQSVTGTVTQVQRWSQIYCHDNLHWGIWSTNGVRKVTYESITCNNNGLRTDLSLTNTGNAADNFTGGFLMDHSESSMDNVQCHNNGEEGLWIRNVFACNFTNVRCTQNVKNGIRVLGYVNSVGSNWLSQGNGTNAALTSHDVWFDGTSTLNYGITSKTQITNIVAGDDHAAAIATQGSWSGNSDYGIFFDDAMGAADVTISAKSYGGTVAAVRLPTTVGSTFIYNDNNVQRVTALPAAGGYRYTAGAGESWWVTNVDPGSNAADGDVWAQRP